MTQWPKLIWVAVSALLFWAPLTLWMWPVVPESRLVGATEKAELPDFSWEGLIQGSYTRKIEGWFTEQLGLRPTAIRLDNQINYSVFDEMPLTRGSRLTLGRDRWMFQQSRIHYYLGWEKRVDMDLLRHRMEGLRGIQDLADSMDKPFVFVIAPIKSTIYPEQMRQSVLKARDPSLKTTYERVRPLFDEFGVRVFDGREAAHQMRAADPGFPVFAPEATHWSFAFAAHCLVDIFRDLDSHTPRALPTFEWHPGKAAKAEGDERDVGLHANLFSTRYDHARIEYPKMHVQLNDGPVRVAIIGDSFAWTLSAVLNGMYCDAAASPQIDVFYYFNNLYRVPGRSQQPFSRDTFDIRQLLRDYDVVMMVTSEEGLWDLGQGVPEAVEKNGGLD